ncbi:MAG: hypothetical protein IKB55_01175 [Clostridia bacterium]|nr:hypothetical protein [Clostridia bacterium]
MVEYKIKTDTKSEKIYYSDFIFTTGDVRAYRFVFDFADTNTENCSIGVKAKRADGTVVIAKSDDCKSFVLPGNMYAVAGEVLFEIALYNATGGCITTKVVTATVRKGLGEEGITADDRYPALTIMINEVTALKLSVADTISEFGDISAALDEIIAIQNSLIGGETA